MKKTILTLEETAEVLNVSPRTVRRLLYDNEIQGAKVRRSLRITLKSIDLYVQKQVDLYNFENGYGQNKRSEH